MISRVTAALTQFIKPVASSPSSKLSVEEKPERQEKREKRQSRDFQPDNPPRDNTPDNTNVIPFPDKAREKEQAEEPPQTKTVEEGQNFIQLFNLLQEGRDKFIRWIGTRAYFDPKKGNARKRIYKKGAMLDQKAE